MKLARFLYNFRYGFNPRKPRLLARAARSYLSILRGGEPLRYMDLNVGLACNLRCEHCFSENFKRDGAVEMTDAEWRRVIDECAALGMIAIGFTGGEPLAYKRIYDLIELSDPGRFVIIVCTNGVLLTPDAARRLKRAGVDVVQISVESALPEEHDRFRGRDGAHAATLRAVDAALDAGLKVTAVPTVSRGTIRTEGFRRLVSWSSRKGILLNLSLAAPVGPWAGDAGVLMTADDRRDLDRLVASTRHVRRDFETNYLRQGCGAANEKLYFTPYGDVLACPYMHISFGNVRSDPVAEIRRRMLQNRYLRGYHPRCLVAEDAEFIERFMPREMLKGGPLPLAEAVFNNHA